MIITKIIKTITKVIDINIMIINIHNYTCPESCIPQI